MDTSTADTVDIVIVGAGVIGLAIAESLSKALPERSIVLLDKHKRFGEENSSRNSEVIHAGLYYPPGSLKATLCLEGRDRLYQYCKQYNIAHQRTGKLIVADKSQHTQLQNLAHNAALNGVDTLQWLNSQDIARLEPAVRADIALYSPLTGIIDSHGFMQSLMAKATANGVLFAGLSQVTAITQPHVDRLELNYRALNQHNVHSVSCRLVVNAAGLGAAALTRQISASLQPAVVPEIEYIKGNYFSYSGSSPFSHLIYPLPERNGRGLGIHATLDLAGRCRFGPDTEVLSVPKNGDVDYDFSVSEQRRSQFAEAIRRYFPTVETRKLQPDYAGIRTRAVSDRTASDFFIEGVKAGNCAAVHLSGMESPGLTASLAVARHVSQWITGQQIFD